MPSGFYTRNPYALNCVTAGSSGGTAVAGFRPALAGCEVSHIARKSRLKGGCRQDCPPHNYRSKAKEMMFEPEATAIYCLPSNM
jgi:hypothetical protein